MVEQQQRILQANLHSRQRQQERARETARAALPGTPESHLQPRTTGRVCVCVCVCVCVRVRSCVHA